MVQTLLMTVVAVIQHGATKLATALSCFQRMMAVLNLLMVLELELELVRARARAQALELERVLELELERVLMLMWASWRAVAARLDATLDLQTLAS